MSRLATGILGAIALSLGAAQLASGRDLTAAQDRLQDRLHSAAVDQSAAGESAVNRAAKADRVASVMGSPARMRTISLRQDGLSETSFLVRVPVANGAADPSSAPPTVKSGERRMMVACEPVVSVLTEVARRLQPGRCVT